jgi:hypothetical protein
VANGNTVINNELFPEVIEHNTTQDITPPFVLPDNATMSIDNLIRKN